MSTIAYKKPRLSAHVWGLSYGWLAVCPRNALREAWIQLPLIYFGVSGEHVELGLGRGKVYVMFEIRWRWE